MTITKAQVIRADKLIREGKSQVEMARKLGVSAPALYFRRIKLGLINRKLTVEQKLKNGIFNEENPVKHKLVVVEEKLCESCGVRYHVKTEEMCRHCTAQRKREMLEIP